MRFRDILLFSMENVLRGGRKVCLSILAIAVGIFSVCLISGAGDLAAGEIEARVTETGLGGLTVFPAKTGENTISVSLLEELPKSIDGLRAVTPFSMETAVLTHRGKNRNVALIGVNEEITKVFDLKLLYGRTFTKADITAGTPTVLVDQTIAQTLYERENITGKTLIFTISGIRFQAEVIGVIASQKQGLESMLGVSLPNLIYIPYSSLDQITGESHTEQIAISCFENKDEDSVAEETARYLELTNQTKYKFENLNKYISSLNEVVDIVRLFIQTVAAISLIVGGLGIMNSMLYTVDARQCEIGICKSLGEPRYSILLRYLAESVILCLFGGFSGIGMTYLLTITIYELTGLQLPISFQMVLQSTTLALVCGVLSGILPAYGAANLDPIDIIIR